MKIDIHCHLLPGIDDGAKSVEDSTEMARALIDLGYDTIAVTPHIRPGIWNNVPEEISNECSKLQKQLFEKNLPLTLKTGAEHFFDAEIENRLSFPYGWGKQQKTFLLELPYGQPPSRALPDVLFRLRIKGIQIILAHPERYKDPLSWVAPLREQGMLIQISLTSLGGKFGRRAKKLAKQLIEKDLVDLVATDAHRVKDLQLVEDAFRWLEKKRGKEDTIRLSEIAPRKILYE